MAFEQFQWLVGFATLADVIYSASRRDPKQVVRSLLLAAAAVLIFGGPKFDNAAAAAATVIAPERSPPDPVVLAPVAPVPEARQVDPQWLRDNDRTTYGRYYAGAGFKPLDSRPQFVASQIRADGSDTDGHKGQMSQFHLTLGK